MPDEASDAAYYFFVPYEGVEINGVMTYLPMVFGGGAVPAEWVDLRDPETHEGYAFVRTPRSPGELNAMMGWPPMPEGVF